MAEAYEDVLKKQGVLVFSPGGTSMMPLLRHHENPVVLEPVHGRLKKGDIAFYKRRDGQYVLHRIIGVKKDGYLCCGDNQTRVEKGVTDDMIFAVLTGFYKDGVLVRADDPAVMRYGRRRMRSRPFRAFKNALARRLHRLEKKKK